MTFWLAVMEVDSVNSQEGKRKECILKRAVRSMMMMIIIIDLGIQCHELVWLGQDNPRFLPC